MAWVLASSLLKTSLSSLLPQSVGYGCFFQMQELWAGTFMPALFFGREVVRNGRGRHHRSGLFGNEENCFLRKAAYVLA
jgi:hypothetical protein